ncbi:aldehyde dehydrogenase family protein [Nocardioides carbamazepini]|uniref:aldehyde dehydrogenase family protein n=1 Tax=Nocardioides carbamazepini TaxID=2854259 RepID=UPI00214A361E|nr:aldehyde dehydrogenase family protein [Nocardioides carbamazepini]MCR1782360.1 aldehyde dehydrogenase family protein [Nocardioides carbamazepini]
MSSGIHSFIAGRLAEDAEQGWVKRTSPTGDGPLEPVAVAGAVTVDAAVREAARAQLAWWSLAPVDRAERIWAWGDRIRAERDALARLDALDVGRVFIDSQRDIESAVKWTRYWAHSVDALCGSQVPAVGGHLMYTVREPLGVMGVVTPWNAPSTTFVARVVAAIACGNGVVVKPSEHATRSALRLAELAVEAGVPAGLVNVVTGDGSTGALLVEHPGVGGVSFTGSVSTGRAVGEAAGRTLKKATLELGGKSPAIVFDDADLDRAISASVWGVFANAGQICTAGTRLLVQESVAGEVVAALAARAEKVRVGDPFASETHIGPLAFPAQKERVDAYVRDALDGGARRLVGAESGTPSGGNYVAPTVLTDVDPDSPIVRQEVFGPVLTVLTFGDADEAVAIANAVDYGLSATVWTRDVGRMLGVAERLEVGAVYGNTPRTGDPALAFGGTKSSGVGNAYARGAVEGATREKAVAVRFDDATPVPRWDDV